ncbi:hypothetical protein WJX72_008335 [[Myrmecia] bisecta]|uniref:Uncharacterized protein n=1 Tax=[Myrmecia] bisecta TaxID=41462 RepID=A0AAW1Q5U2_9CHLO
MSFAVRGLSKLGSSAARPALSGARSATTTAAPGNAKSVLDQLPEPTLNFWEAPLKPATWKYSHQWGFLATMGGGVTYALYNVMTQEKPERK